MSIRVLVSFFSLLFAPPQARLPGPGGASPPSSGTLPALVASIQGPATIAAGGGWSTAINTTGASWIGAFIASNQNASGFLDCVGGTSCGTSTNAWTCTSKAGTNSPEPYFCYTLHPSTGTSHYFELSGGNTYPSFWVWAFSGVISGAYNSDLAGGQVSGTAPTVGPTSPTTGVTMQFTGCGNTNLVSSASITSPAGFATVGLLDENGSANAYGSESSYLIQSSGSAVTVHWAFGTAGELNCIALSFKG